MLSANDVVVNEVLTDESAVLVSESQSGVGVAWGGGYRQVEGCFFDRSFDGNVLASARVFPKVGIYEFVAEVIYFSVFRKVKHSDSFFNG